MGHSIWKISCKGRLWRRGKVGWPSLILPGLVILIGPLLYTLYAELVIGLPRRPADASANRMQSDLQTVRSQLKLYQMQHNGEYPPAKRLEQCMVGYTNINHEQREANSKGSLGPYLQKIPDNPFNGLRTIEIADEDSKIGDGSHGWYFDPKTGKFTIDWISEPYMAGFKKEWP